MSEIPEGYTRVTEVFKPFLDFSMINPDVLANAADRGTRVHKACELYAANMLFFEVDSDCEPYVQSFKKWFDDHVECVLHTEIRLNSEKYKLSGSIDLICRLKGRCGTYIVDIKTPMNPSKTWGLQTAAYRMLARDGMHIECERICLMLHKKGGMAKELQFFDHDAAEASYISALNLYRYFLTPLQYEA